MEICATDPLTIVHEMTHAVQQIELGYPMDYATRERDEGQAFAMEGFYRMAKSLKIMEERFRRSTCNRTLIANQWKSFWKQYGVLPSDDWGKVKWGGLISDGQRPVSQRDLQDLYDIFAVKLSCAAVAEAANGVLGSAGCCLSVKCSGTETPFEIAPGVTLSPLFQ